METKDRQRSVAGAKYKPVSGLGGSQSSSFLDSRVEATFAAWNVSYDVIGCSGKLSEWLTEQQP